MAFLNVAYSSVSSCLSRLFHAPATPASFTSRLFCAPSLATLFPFQSLLPWPTYFLFILHSSAEGSLESCRPPGGNPTRTESRSGFDHLCKPCSESMPEGWVLSQCCPRDEYMATLPEFAPPAHLTRGLSSRGRTQRRTAPPASPAPGLSRWPGAG